jgi:hypothetical protein
LTGSGIATVARQEFRLRIRAGRWKWLLGHLLPGAARLHRPAARRAVAGLARTLAFKGTVLYGGLMLFVLGLALLVVPRWPRSR